MSQDPIQANRFLLKDSVRLTIDFRQTDQARGKPPPPIEKPFSPDQTRIDLVPPDARQGIPALDVKSAIAERQSHRQFRREALSLEEVSFLLWATQGIRERLDQGTAYRTVPSAGCRHALETYLLVNRVEGLPPGLYRYLALEHKLVAVDLAPGIAEAITKACWDQAMVQRCAATFIWVAVAERMTWRYGQRGYRYMHLDVGHVCQNLYLAAQSVGGGACAIAAFSDEDMNRLLGLDGEEQFVIYLATMGKRP